MIEEYYSPVRYYLFYVQDYDIVVSYEFLGKEPGQFIHVSDYHVSDVLWDSNEPDINIR